MQTLVRFAVGVVGFFFAAVAFAGPPSDRHNGGGSHYRHHERHLERDLAYIAGAAIVGSVIYNATRPSVEYVPVQPQVQYQPPVTYAPQYARPSRYYDMQWVYFPQCNCYRYVTVEVYR